jgi:hypothetical protein
MGGKGKKLKEVTTNRYVNLLKLPFVKKEEYYWVNNNYLYVSNPNVRAVRLVAFFEDDIDIEVMFPDCDCGNTPSLDELCKNPLDKEFPCPGYLEKQVIELTSQKLLSTYFRLKTDLSNEGLDEQAPNVTKATK